MNPSSRLYWQAAAVLAFSLAAAGCGALKKPAQPDPAVVEEMRTFRKSALEAFKKGDLEQAYALTEKAIALGEKNLVDFPKDLAVIRLEKALVQHARGNFSDAEAESSKVMQALKDTPELQREYAQAVGIHGGAIYKQGKTEEAISALSEAIQGYQKSGDINTVNGLSLLNGLSQLLFQEGRFDEAGKTASQIQEVCLLPSTRIPVQSRLQVLTKLGQSAFEQKQWKMALDNYQSALHFGKRNHEITPQDLLPIQDGIAKSKEMLESAPK